MRTWLCFLVLLYWEAERVAAQSTQALQVTTLRTEYLVNPIGIDVRQPRLSWQLQSDRRDVRQAAYQIQVASSREALVRGRNLIWDSGRVASDQSVFVPYGGPPLGSRQRYYWRVRVWDNQGRTSPWSEPAFWEMGLLSPAEWQAQWITPDWEEDTSRPQPVPMLRRTFQVSGRIRQARLYITSLGLYEAHLNGQRVGDQLFTPGWTSYHHRLQYQTYDVTDLLRQGENALGVLLGDGWYRGYLAWGGRRNTYGDRLALLAQLEITYTDGRTQVVTSDPNWKATTGPIRFSDIYMGETYDARLEKTGWTEPGYNDRDWQSVRVLDHPKDILVAPIGVPVRRIQEIRPVAILYTPEGDTVVDMGQNMVGWVRLRVRGPAGTVVTLRHAEVLDKQGNFYTLNLRAAKQTDQYILKGVGEEVYEPHFTFHGFRYVAVSGYPGKLTPEAITGIVIHSDFEPAGHWESSDPLLNQLQHNIQWGMKGNFLDVPTDCPQRDERLGWTGDAQVFARTAMFNGLVGGFFTKWLRDLAADQNEEGVVPHVIPNVLPAFAGRFPGGATGWADAAVIIPWTMYQVYGDRRILEEQYASMKAWVEYMRREAGEDLIWDSGFHFGDWLAFVPEENVRRAYPGATTGRDFLATAHFAYSTHLLAQAAEVLGKIDEARHYQALYEAIKEAFNREFVTPNGRVAQATQTAYTLALQFDLVPPEKRLEIGRRLAEDVRRHNMHLTTGFLGTPHLLHALSSTGQLDVAYALLKQDTYPSWLYQVKMGATTMWERWDSIKPDSTFQDPSMNSFNHYAYGSVGDWMYRVIAGIDAELPGYQRLRIAPKPGGGLRWVRARQQTLYGEVASSWELIDAQTFVLEVRIPVNTTATVRLPGARLETVREGQQLLQAAAGVHRAYQDGSDVVVELGSGAYRFTYPPAADLIGRVQTPPDVGQPIQQMF